MTRLESFTRAMADLEALLWSPICGAIGDIGKHGDTAYSACGRTPGHQGPCAWVDIGGVPVARQETLFDALESVS